MPDKLLDADRQTQDAPQDGSEPFRVAGLTGQVTREVALGQVGHGIAILKGGHPGAAEAREIDPEAIPRRAIEADRRLGLGPSPIEQGQHAVIEEVQKAGEGGIRGVPQPVPDEFGEMQGQRAVGSQQAHEIDQQTGGAACGRTLQGRQLRRCEAHGWLLAQAHRVVCRTRRGADARAIRLQGVEPAQGLAEPEAPGFAGQIREQFRTLT